MLRASIGFMIIACFVAALPARGETTSKAPTTRPLGRPAMELKKILSFPLEGGALPTTNETLASAISDGLNKRLQLPAGAKPVRVQGSGYPKLDQLIIDFTDAAVSESKQAPKLYPRGKWEQLIHASRFQVIANPLKIDGADMHMHITAEDVAMVVQRDPTNKPILVLASAENGKLDFHTTMPDLSRMFKASANFRGASYGLSVSKSDLKLISNNEHQLAADLKLNSRLVLLPIQLHFTADVEVEDNGNAHLSNLKCSGDDAAGWLISGIIQPALKRYNEQSMPLVAFPTDQIKLNQLRVKLDGDNVRVTAGFGT